MDGHISIRPLYVAIVGKGKTDPTSGKKIFIDLTLRFVTSVK